MARWKVAGINFDFMHMMSLLGDAHAHPQVDLVGIAHTNREGMHRAIAEFSLDEAQVYTDYAACLEQTRPDIVILCPKTGEHAEWVEHVAPFGSHIILEKPFATSLAGADRIIAAVQASGKTLAINWPLAWYPPHRTTKRLIDEGAIGEVIEVHYYDGNRGDNFGGDQSWFLKKDQGGGSLIDYLGYGVTLGTWFMDNRMPLEVASMDYVPEGWEVDNHSISLVRYPQGLSKFETRWGTLSSPWILQPQPKCGFVVVGTTGNISSYDYESTIRLQTEADPAGQDIPVDDLQSPHQNPVQYLIHTLEARQPLTGPLSVETARIGQLIVDAAQLSAKLGRTVQIEEVGSQPQNEFRG